MREVLEQVAANLTRNKLRSFLTMAGIAWGVASIVLIVAMGDGFKLGQKKNLKQLGENIVIVFGGRTEKQAGGQRAGRRVFLNYRDLRDIREECFLVKRAAPELESNARAISRFNSGSFTVQGVEPVFAELRTVVIDGGRFLADADERDARRVCILGNNVRKQLFASRPGVLGSEIRLNGYPYTVVGLMPDKQQNSSYNGRDIDKIFIPYSSMTRDLPPKASTYIDGVLSDIVYAPASLDDWKGAQKQVRRVLARNHGYSPDDLAAIRMWDTVEGAELTDRIFTSMTAFLGTIALVTLTLGGVGVLNIMLVSVTERTREIGLRKALGARRIHILRDFMVEGLVLTLASGLVGWLGSWGLASVVNSFPMPEMFGGLPVTGKTTGWAFGALAVIAIVSALWPAWKAASLTPVEALRYER
ncbi:MAG: ABC transporter permease [Bryobacteraceae bacterium]